MTPQNMYILLAQRFQFSTLPVSLIVASAELFKVDKEVFLPTDVWMRVTRH